MPPRTEIGIAYPGTLGVTREPIGVIALLSRFIGGGVRSRRGARGAPSKLICLGIICGATDREGAVGNCAVGVMPIEGSPWREGAKPPRFTGPRGPTGPAERTQGPAAEHGCNFICSPASAAACCEKAAACCEKAWLAASGPCCIGACGAAVTRDGTDRGGGVMERPRCLEGAGTAFSQGPWPPELHPACPTLCVSVTFPTGRSVGAICSLSLLVTAAAQVADTLP